MPKRSDRPQSPKRDTAEPARARAKRSRTPAEDPVETAIREVLEETGVWAHVEPKFDDANLGDKKLKDETYSVNNDVIKVRFYLMRGIGRGLPQGTHEDDQGRGEGGRRRGDVQPIERWRAQG